MNKIRLSCIFSCLLATTALSILTARAEVIKRIEVQGNKRVEKQTILSYLDLQPGNDLYLPAQDKAIKNLYSTYLFEDIKLKIDNGVLKVMVKEFPLITKVEFKGNYKISNSTLKKETTTKIGSSVNSSSLKADIVKIKELYKRQSKFLVDVNVKIEKLKNERAKVIFEISEGPKTEVANIYFVGNKNYRSSELKSIIATKEKIWFKFWANNAYDPEKIEHDKYLLKRFYNSLGYADFQIISVNPQISKNKDYFNITYVIDEGQKYTFGTIDTRSEIKGINAQDLKQFIKIKTGDRYNKELLDQIAEDMSHYCENQGYPGIIVVPEPAMKDHNKRIVNIVFVVAKAEKVYINKLNIIGNVKTSDKVIRREFQIAEGDLFNRDDIDRGEKNLRNLDYFETVSVRPVVTNSSDKYDLNVNLAEKSTASVGLEGGYSSAEGPFARLAYNERNFLGKGQSLATSITKGKNVISYSLGMAEPYFLDRNMLLGGSFSIHKSGIQKGSFGSGDQPYKVTSYSTKIRLGYNITNDLYHELFQVFKYENLKANPGSSSIYILEQQGKFTTLSVGHSLTYDKSDNRVFPKNGYILSGSQEYAGLGGDIKFLKHEADASFYKSFFENEYTIKLIASAGQINGVNQKVRIRDRFNMGDPIFRGFSSAGMGPRVKATKEGLGGQRFYKITSEFSFPMGLPRELNVTGHVFADYGSLWHFDIPKNATYQRQDISSAKKPNLSVGFGILWITKIAPIRIDYAIPLRKNKYDETQRWHFGFTASF